MHPVTDEFNDLLLAMEATAHAHGWDQPPHLVVFKDGDMHVHIPCTANDLAGLPPQHATAVAFISEAWSYPEHLLRQLTTIELAEAMHRRMPPSAHPERVELRMAVVYASGGLSLVKRIRGEEPQVESADRMDGRVPAELRRLYGKGPRR